MRRAALAITAAAILQATAALGGDAATAAGPGLLGGLAQTIGALALVIGAILLLSHAANRWLRGGRTIGRAPRYIRLVETRCLAPKKALMLVEVGGEYLLLSTTADGMRLVKQIDMLEEIEVLAEAHDEASAADTLLDRLRDGLATLPARLAAPAALRRRMEALR